jgi:hypothetical protein
VDGTGNWWLARQEDDRDKGKWLLVNETREDDERRREKRREKERANDEAEKMAIKVKFKSGG